MKNASIFILIMVNISAYSQNFEKGCWIPEHYVDSLAKHSTHDLSNLIKPIQSILTVGDSILIMSYGGEYLASTTRKLEKNKLEITNFKNLINLNYSSARTYTEKTCFISKQAKYLMLEVGNGDSWETVKFIRESDGFAFSNFNEVNVMYALNGDYTLNGRTITFEFNGDIRGSDSWSTYQLLRAGYGSVDDRRNTYNLVSFKGRDEGTYAIQVNHGELLVWKYESMDKGDYLIKLSATPIYTLKRIE